MTTLYSATNGALAIVSQHNGGWAVDLQMRGAEPQCLAVDSQRPQQVYCGTFDQGLWRSENAGESWEHVGAGIEQQSVTSVAVSLTERAGNYGVVYAGTEPSTLYRSEDGGSTWRELSALRQVPSAPTWSFPPRPYTSHVRWITPDPLVAGRLFAAIEAGALLRSLDGGQTWYRPDEGLQHHYLWGVAADPANPATLVISAAHGPQQAHNPQSAESALYRRSGNGPWQRVQDGFPEPRGLLTAVLATHEAEPGVFYAANNKGALRSADAGSSWEALPIRWPQGMRIGRAHALAVVPE